MKRNTLILASATLLLLSATGAVFAADGGAETTIRLMDAAEADLPEAVTKSIELPLDLMAEPALEKSKAVEKAKDALKEAEQHRDEGRQKGIDASYEARMKGADMADQAKDNRDTRGRSDPPGRPENLPEPPNNPPGD